jgi:hypothetical protein
MKILNCKRKENSDIYTAEIELSEKEQKELPCEYRNLKYEINVDTYNHFIKGVDVGYFMTVLPVNRVTDLPVNHFAANDLFMKYFKEKGMQEHSENLHSYQPYKVDEKGNSVLTKSLEFFKNINIILAKRHESHWNELGDHCDISGLIVWEDAGDKINQYSIYACYHYGEAQEEILYPSQSWNEYKKIDKYLVEQGFISKEDNTLDENKYYKKAKKIFWNLHLNIPA